jgi:hypothetical protein
MWIDDNHIDPAAPVNPVASTLAATATGSAEIHGIAVYRYGRRTRCRHVAVHEVEGTDLPGTWRLILRSLPLPAASRARLASSCTRHCARDTGSIPARRNSPSPVRPRDTLPALVAVRGNQRMELLGRHVHVCAINDAPRWQVIAWLLEPIRGAHISTRHRARLRRGRTEVPSRFAWVRETTVRRVPLANRNREGGAGPGGAAASTYREFESRTRAPGI